jgi:hypothetical protein
MAGSSRPHDDDRIKPGSNDTRRSAVSRYIEGDFDDENWALDMGRWQHNSRAVLKGKRGQKALRELREALMALPEHRLIEGAVCTVGAEQRHAGHVAEAVRSWERQDPQWRGKGPWMDEVEEFDRQVQRSGEGVCAVGALLWHRKVKAGADPAEAFATLPDLPDEGSDGLHETAKLAKQEAGLVYTLAWELAYRNDETFAKKTPEERWEAFVAWIDEQLAGEAAAA